MNDFLLNLGQKSFAGKMLSSLGVPVPHGLRRLKTSWPELPLKGRDVVVGGAGSVHPEIANALIPAGANVYAAGDCITAYEGPGEAFSRPVKALESQNDGLKAHGYIFDATHVQSPDDLLTLFEFFQPRIRKLAGCGRVLVIGRPGNEQKDLSAAAAAGALEGFTRSIAKEIGMKGATAQIIQVQTGAESRLEGLIRFLLSDASAYISGQPFLLTKTVRAPKTIHYVRSLEGKIALVTGAARGIGKATARKLAQEGALVVCLDRPDDDGPLSVLAKEINGDALLQDIYEPDAAEKIKHYLKEKHDGVDIVVHNAGITRDKTLGKMSQERWDQVIGVNLRAVVDLTESLLKDGLRSEGRIICLSSIAGIAGNFGQTNYAASKSGLISFVRKLSTMVGRRGIAVNAVAPGFIETRLTAAMPFLTREVGRRLCNLSQSGLPEDVAQVITFLATPGSYGLTGSVIRACGGMLLGA
ncbi:3-oxoacyl-ACP reductase [candidate division CSSED10-310 bacterium]|uniref:3-oxoacyl-ACP reductase n=1 Tax=candidate division CSSED10-310 bacterium TaxID=2855610 RepID=A0ABV6YYX8_UNCC1